MTYLIIDDEPIAHRIIETYCRELPYLQKVGNAYNAFEAAKLVSQQAVELIFLDINMPKMTGFELLKTWSTPPKVIVTTAYKEYALEGYDLNIVDYLLKPFSFARFLKAVNKAASSSNTKPPSEVLAESRSSSQRFFLKGDKKHHQIHMDDILFIEAHGNYTKVYLANEMILSHEKISSLEVLLPQEEFLRVHKSFIVAIDRIKVIEGNQVVMQNHKIPIGQTYKSMVNRLMKKK